MNTILSIANGFLQYHRGKQTGISGLIGIIFALIIVFQWDHILPILESLGILKFFDNLGLIYKGESGLTGFAILMFVMKLTLIWCATLFILLVIGILCTMIFSSEIIFKYCILPIMIVIGFPLIVFFLLFDRIINRKKYIAERKHDILVEHLKSLVGTPQDQLLNYHSEIIQKEQALLRLNRIPTYGDDQFLLGKSKDNILYMLLPRPLDFNLEKEFEGKLYAVQYSIEKYYERDYILQTTKPMEFIIKPIKDECELVQLDDIVVFYDTQHVDMRNAMNTFACSSEYQNYVGEQQNNYFVSKETIINKLKNSTDKEEFDHLLKLLKMFKAPNEDIVKIMLNSEKDLKI
jgi:hypothetical protein